MIHSQVAPFEQQYEHNQLADAEVYIVFLASSRARIFCCSCACGARHLDSKMPALSWATILLIALFSVSSCHTRRRAGPATRARGGKPAILRGPTWAFVRAPST